MYQNLDKGANEEAEIECLRWKISKKRNTGKENAGLKKKKIDFILKEKKKCIKGISRADYIIWEHVWLIFKKLKVLSEK